jgi:hypothetical protein
LVEILQNHFPDTFNIISEFQSSGIVSRLSLDALKLEKQELAKGLEDMSKEIKILKKSGDNNDSLPLNENMYFKKIVHFFEEHNDKFIACEKLYEEMNVSFHKALEFFGEKKDISLQEYFGNIKTFIVSLDRCWKKLESSKQNKIQKQIKEINKDEGRSKDGSTTGSSIETLKISFKTPDISDGNELLYFNSSWRGSAGSDGRFARILEKRK